MAFCPSETCLLLLCMREFPSFPCICGDIYDISHTMRVRRSVFVFVFLTSFRNFQNFDFTLRERERESGFVFQIVK